jgi:3-oxoacyl-(acyl-carrier-protein) reductase
MELKGKVSLITGSSRGIGRATAVMLAEAGSHVAVNYGSNEKAAGEVVKQVEGMGVRAKAYRADISNSKQTDAMIDQVLDDFGTVQVLVNNAGITRDRSFKKMSQDMWDAVLAVNLTGVFTVTKQFIDGMADRGWGRVINVSSIVGEVGNFGQANYAASKAGVIGLTKTLAREYARKGVTVNAVAPGFIKTRMLQDVPEKALEAVINMTPVGRLGEAEEIAAAIAFLASPAASFITGHVLDVNGGMSMGG